MDNFSDYGRYDSDNKPLSKNDRLAALGINMQGGLEYCAGMEEFYFEVLNEYADSEVSDSELRKYLDAGDLKEYRTLIHGIKSSSKIIGAMEMFTRAEKLEFAARDNDLEYIRINNDEFMKDYHRLISGIKSIEA